MDDIQKLSDEIFRDRIRRAREMSPEEKFFSGGRLFEYACEITLAGIRNQYPQATEEDVREILRRRIEIQQRLENRR